MAAPEDRRVRRRAEEDVRALRLSRRAYLAIHPRHVNLGCNYGAHLDDGGLLEGTGQNMRRMTVRTVDALDDPRLVPLLRAARRERMTALGRN
jgi:hypothetical protein